jgi:hypothetical protein
VLRKEGDPIGVNIDNNSNEKVVLEFTEGNWQNIKVFQLYPKFEEQLTIGSYTVSAYIAKNGKIAFRAWDFVFTEYPDVKVNVQWNGERYGLSKEEMVRVASVDEESDIIQDYDSDISESEWVTLHISASSIWRKFPDKNRSKILELIYSGNSKLVWEAFDKIWHEKETILANMKDLRRILSHSRYWEDIKSFNPQDNFLNGPMD